MIETEWDTVNVMCYRAGAWVVQTLDYYPVFSSAVEQEARERAANINSLPLADRRELIASARRLYIDALERRFHAWKREEESMALSPTASPQITQLVISDQGFSLLFTMGAGAHYLTARKGEVVRLDGEPIEFKIKEPEPIPDISRPCPACASGHLRAKADREWAVCDNCGHARLRSQLV